MMKPVVAATLAFLLLGGLMGCGPEPLLVPPKAAQEVTPPEPPHTETSEQVRLKDALTGQEMSAAQVADLSDRILADDNSLNDQETMARLELLILKTMKSSDKSHSRNVA